MGNGSAEVRGGGREGGVGFAPRGAGQTNMRSEREDCSSNPTTDATSSAPILSPVPGLNVMSVVHTLRHRRLWILRERGRPRQNPRRPRYMFLLSIYDGVARNGGGGNRGI